MREDVELEREILLKIESAGYTGSFIDVEIPGRTAAEISFHVELLADDDLVETIDLSSVDGLDVRPQRLTRGGHQFLESIRDQSRWDKIKATAAREGKALVLAAVRELAVRAMSGGL